MRAERMREKAKEDRVSEQRKNRNWRVGDDGPD